MSDAFRTFTTSSGKQDSTRPYVLYVLYSVRTSVFEHTGYGLHYKPCLFCIIEYTRKFGEQVDVKLKFLISINVL